MALETDSAYGALKRVGEIWAQEVKAASVRVWNVYGPMEELGIRSHVVSDLIWSGLNDGVVRLRTNGSERRRFVHIDDLVRGMVEAVDARRPSTQEVYDLAASDYVTISHVARIIADELGVPVEYGTEYGREVFDQELRPLPGWSPTVSLEVGLQRACRLAVKELENSSGLIQVTDQRPKG